MRVLIWRRFIRHRLAVVSSIVLLLIVVVAGVSILVSIYNSMSERSHVASELRPWK